MEHLGELSIGWASLWCLVWAFLSAILPWMNAEVLILALPAVASSRKELAMLILIATTGQMAGKCIIYWVALRGTACPSGRIARAVERWRERAAANPSSPVALVALSSLVGIPPFYVMSAVAGALRMNFGSFFVAGACGRLVRFGAVAFLSKSALQLIGS